jgi:DNA-binding transcriptional MocR family regulator
MAPTISSELVIRLIENGTASEIIAEKRKLIAHRLALAKTVLQGFSFQTSENSMFLWLTLPEGWSCADFENIALMNKIRVISAYKFYVGNQLPPNAVRISLSSVKSDEQLLKGLTGLVRILKQNPMLTSPVM